MDRAEVKVYPSHDVEDKARIQEDCERMMELGREYQEEITGSDRIIRLEDAGATIYCRSCSIALDRKDSHGERYTRLFVPTDSNGYVMDMNTAAGSDMDSLIMRMRDASLGPRQEDMMPRFLYEVEDKPMNILRGMHLGFLFCDYILTGILRDSCVTETRSMDFLKGRWYGCEKEVFGKLAAMLDGSIDYDNAEYTVRKGYGILVEGVMRGLRRFASVLTGRTECLELDRQQHIDRIFECLYLGCFEQFIDCLEYYRDHMCSIISMVLLRAEDPWAMNDTGIRLMCCEYVKGWEKLYLLEAEEAARLGMVFLSPNSGAPKEPFILVPVNREQDIQILRNYRDTVTGEA